MQTGITLQVSNDLEVNVHLSIGATDTVVNVETSSNQIQTEDNSINTVVDQARVVDLPLNGRNAATLFSFPEVQPLPSPGTWQPARVTARSERTRSALRLQSL